ncbi:mannosyltransferase putative-domain-containing protein [Entophlyctis helioformis]|nr:mannosyltransferase putative-domain-containing protein [Entophlyctis helioformis]KAI8927558.1 mannosyltransferase putative-domain-containing protein [Entophlyctis helioformis]
MYTALHSHGVVELGLPVSRLEAAVYPWLDRGGKWSSVAQMAASFKGRGIVMASGVWHSKLALHAATVVRQLGCHLPIELYYSGEADLPAQIRAVLETVPGLKTVDLSTIVDTVSPGVSGWAVKPYAMLVSSFEEIIFIDADALFFQRPDVLFESAAYRETGAVFFMDRTLYPGAETASRQFFLDMVPQPSEYAHRAGRLVPRLSIHEGESGVIVWDKRRSLHAMLLSCVMNSSPYRDEMYKAYHGDKESYWIAHEALNMPYRWLPGGGGAIGFVKANTLNLANPITICGGLYHTDEQWRPLWFNGGIMRNKYTTQGQVGMNLTHWAVDRTFRGTTWEWETDDMPFCLTPEQPGRDIGKLTADERDVADMMLRVWIEQNPSAPQP